MIKRITNSGLAAGFFALTARNVKTLRREADGGFTLVEILVVISIAGILALVSVPAIQGLQQAGGFDKSVYTMSDSLNFARAYAMAQHTYVYVGLTEVSRTQNPGASPQVAGIGKVILSVVATTDGLSDTSSWSTTGTNLAQVRQTQILDSFHIASSAFPTTTIGAMARPANVTTTPVVLPAASAPATPFSLPLGSASGSGKYNFNTTNSEVLCFNPQGGVLFNGSSFQWLELDVQPVMGAVAPAIPTNVSQGNQAALVIDGLTGTVSIYRP